MEDSWKPNPAYVEEARRLIGEKAALTGGGMPVQFAYIVRVKDVTVDGHAVLETLGWDYPDNKVAEFSPLLMSWRVVALNSQYRHLPLGRYDLLTGVRDRPRTPVVRIAPKGTAKYSAKGGRGKSESAAKRRTKTESSLGTARRG